MGVRQSVNKLMETVTTKTVIEDSNICNFAKNCEGLKVVK